MQPVSLPLAEIAQNLGALIGRGEMQIGGLLAHGLEDRFLVAMLGQLCELDPTAMWPKPADHPPILDEIIWIALPYRALEHVHREWLVLRPPVCPPPS